MMKHLSILGATGSIGTSALDVVRMHPDRFQVKALTAANNLPLLCRQIKEFSPEMVAVLFLWEDDTWSGYGEGTVLHGVNTTWSWLNVLSSDTRYYWRIELVEDGYTSYIPAVGQSSLFVGGFRCFTFLTEPNLPPQVDSYSPVNGSNYNPLTMTLYVNASNPGYPDRVYYQMLLLYEISGEQTFLMIDEGYFWEDYQYVLTPEMFIDNWMLHAPQGSIYGWRLNMTDDDTHVSFPDDYHEDIFDFSNMGIIEDAVVDSEEWDTADGVVENPDAFVRL
ncbi:MAG: hypothetical protein R6U16_00565, partial [Desulfotignum sp.]